MTGDDLRARPNAVTTNGVRLGWIAVTEAERDALADLIDAARALLADMEGVRVKQPERKGDLRRALAALDQEAPA